MRTFGGSEEHFEDIFQVLFLYATSIVNDIIMPLLNPLIPTGDWREMEIGPGIKIGSFAGTVLDFLFIAIAVFMIVRGSNDSLSLFHTGWTLARETPRMATSGALMIAAAPSVPNTP